MALIAAKTNAQTPLHHEDEHKATTRGRASAINCKNGLGQERCEQRTRIRRKAQNDKA